MSGAAFKGQVAEILRSTDLETMLAAVLQLPSHKTIRALLSLFCDPDEFVRWRAISAMGAVTAALAEQDMEVARIIMRRLLWSLSDESGGIGWGIPEAMGEIMARHQGLALEYHHMLISYIRPDGNYIEYDMLQRGVLWGLGRLAQARPNLLKAALPMLVPYFSARDPVCRGLAGWAAGLISPAGSSRLLKELAKDQTKMQIYLDGNLICRSIAQLTTLPAGLPERQA